MLDWCHSSCLFCCPGITRIRFIIQQRFWWPTLSADFKEFVSACQVCAQSKTSRRPPSGLLRPLPVSRRPWSHISIDFVTGLPPSHGHTTILTIVDRFSKMIHFIPLPKLPSAKEIADLLTTHVFRLYSIPQDIVLDRGPQLTAKFWSEFCRLLQVSVSLSSGFHPQSNGQTERLNQELETDF